MLHLLYPRLCEGCRRALTPDEDTLCLHCELELPFTCYHHIRDNTTVTRLAGRFPFEHATSLAWFTREGLLQHLIHRLKYQRRKQTGVYLGRLLGQALLEQHWDLDAIVPVPLHPRKERQRGYNQSVLIAQGVASILQIPVRDKAFVRTRFTATQTDKNREERIRNVEAAFSVRKAGDLAGKHLLLLDDVLTTGATVESLALTALNIPGVRVSIATCGIAYG